MSLLTATPLTVALLRVPGLLGQDVAPLLASSRPGLPSSPVTSPFIIHGPSLPVSPTMQLLPARETLSHWPPVIGPAPLEQDFTGAVSPKLNGTSWWSRPTEKLSASACWPVTPPARGLSSCPKLPRLCPAHPTGMLVGDADAEAEAEADVAVVLGGAEVGGPPVT